MMVMMRFECIRCKVMTNKQWQLFYDGDDDESNADDDYYDERVANDVLFLTNNSIQQYCDGSCYHNHKKY